MQVAYNRFIELHCQQIFQTVYCRVDTCSILKVFITIVTILQKYKTLSGKNVRKNSLSDSYLEHWWLLIRWSFLKIL